ncbi:MAG: sugar transferase [Clostridia bacterium]|nr:sugar transferase [Clostridia bacterium]
MVKNNLLEAETEQLERNHIEITVFSVPVRRDWGYLFVKRTFDILVSACAGLILLIPMLIIAVIIRIDSPGPAIFKQQRLGKNAKPFTIYKFRSMYIDAEAGGPQWADKYDDRCTKIGRFLRKTRLDELPQFWNIFIGDMSIVGPRPERAVFYDEFETYIHGFRNRMLVQPGLTGYAQVNGGYDLKPEEKIIYDMYYIEHQSIKMDLQCIFQTVFIVFSHEGAR